MKYLMLLSLLAAFNVQAETTPDDLTLADEAIHTPAMDIEGQYHEKETAVPVAVEEVKAAPKRVVIPPKKLTASEKLRMYRERLEERNRIMVEKKMEQIRYQQEVALARKLEQSMNQTLQAIDTIK